MIDRLAHCQDWRWEISFHRVTEEGLTYSRELMSHNEHKRFAKPLSCVTHWILSLLSNRKKNRKGTGNVFGVSFSNWENKFILKKEKECSVSLHPLLFKFGLIFLTKWKGTRKKTMGRGKLI